MEASSYLPMLFLACTCLVVRALFVVSASNSIDKSTCSVHDQSEKCTSVEKGRRSGKSDNVMMQWKTRVSFATQQEDSASAAACCAKCGGKHFCSLESGNCYDWKETDFGYVTCEVDSVGTTSVIPGTGDTLAPESSGTAVPECCNKCGGKSFCSPNSGNCYDSKQKPYYATCGELGDAISPEEAPHSSETEGECCNNCGGGFPFCSPNSGGCYYSKSKEYYQGCTTTTTTPCAGSCPIKVISLNLADGQGVSSRAIAPTVGGQMPFDLGGFQEPRGWLENMRFQNSDILQWYQSDVKRWPKTNPAPIAWNMNRFEALDNGTYTEVARDGCGARVLEMVHVKDRSSGKKILFGNTHGPVAGVCGWGTSGWEYDKNMADAIRRSKGDSEIVIVTGDFNTGPQTLSQTRAILGNKVEGAWNIDMILSNVPCVGGSFDGGRSDHDGVQATCDLFGDVTPEPDSTTASTCCEKCGDKPFCSPNSNNCYDSKRKPYYVSCDVSTR